MQNIISISDFNEIVNGVKGMKADLVGVYGNMLIGTDNSTTILKTYQMNTTIPCNPFTIYSKELSAEFFANITDTNIIIDFNKCKIYCPNNTTFIDSKPNPMIENGYITNSIFSRYKNLQTEKIKYNIYQYGEITNEENFQKYKLLKTADGTYLYIPDNNLIHGMYLYNGAIPVNKMDKVELEVYDNSNIFISKFTVYKKKLNPIDVYFKFLKLR